MREALSCKVCQLVQLPSEVARVGDDPLALAPDPIGVDIELVDTLFGHRRDVRRVSLGLLTVLVGLALRGRDDLVGRVIGLLEKVGDLVADPLERAADGRVRSRCSACRSRICRCSCST